ncbi:MAG: Lrp/AsnC family transcriptional regulator [Candidatus Thorarchaeota archaeon]|nr:Lrp/AsnC family transcriptional regulator [Candidatus Thorarchaeota archaeon]
MLDEEDMRILEELRHDAGRPVRAIASELGMRRSTVQYRIERMKQQGIIKRIVAVPNYSVIGLGVTAIVLVTYMPQKMKSQEEVAAEIAAIQGVSEVHIVAGSWDIILKVRGNSLEEIGNLVLNRLRKIQGVGQTVTCGCFFTLKEEP